jgi:hypothetical protein
VKQRHTVRTQSQTTDPHLALKNYRKALPSICQIFLLSGKRQFGKGQAKQLHKIVM